MPNIITHKIFAEEMLKSATKHDIRSIIERRPRIFYIGSDGPDFPFFSHIKPWESYKSHTLNRLSSVIHAHGINTFYGIAIECTRTQKYGDVKELMSVYLFGHPCHWTLGETTHPYIFYRMGDCRGTSVGLHHRFESVMGIMISEKYHGLSIRDYPCHEVCAYDEDILKAIARIYILAICKIYHYEAKVHDIRETLNSWYDVQKLLYDSADIKYPLLKSFETPARRS